MRSFRLLSFTLILAYFAFAEEVLAHDEPPKTQAEKAEQAKNRDKFKENGIEQQQLWIVSKNDSTQTVDSILFLTNRFDRLGNLVEQTVLGKVGNPHSISLYDEQCQMLEELSYSGDTLEERNVFVYNRDDVITSIVSYDNRGQVAGQLDYQYRESTRQIYVKKTDPPDSLQYTIVYTYDPGSGFRHQIEIVQSNPDGSLRMKVENQYNGEQRIKKNVFDSDEKLMHSFSYMYTTDGEFSEIIKSTATDSLAYRQTYQYTPEGLLSSIIERDGGGTVKRTLRYVYLYFDTIQ